jgi:hypothetical protein
MRARRILAAHACREVDSETTHATAAPFAHFNEILPQNLKGVRRASDRPTAMPPHKVWPATNRRAQQLFTHD